MATRNANTKPETAAEWERYFFERRTFWDRAHESWWPIFYRTVMVAPLLLLLWIANVLAFVMPEQQREAERFVAECPAQEGHEPFRVSQWQVVCIDKSPAKEVGSQQAD